MTAGAAVAQGAFLGILALIAVGMVLVAIAEHGWRPVAWFFGVAATVVAFPVVGALISYTIVIGW